MKIKCGTDIIEIERIKKSIEDLGERFLNRIFTTKEIEYCESKGQQKYQHYAARFAVKEAVYKALSQDIEEKYITWKNIEILKDQNNRPKINLEIIQNKCISNIDISISHCKEYAVANAVVLFN